MTTVWEGSVGHACLGQEVKGAMVERGPRGR